MSTNIPSQLQQLAKDLVSDKDFRAKFKQSPKEAIAERLSTRNFTWTWPEGVQIKVIENDKNTLNVIFPSIDKDGKLTDDDLNSLAAGEFIVGTFVAASIGIGAAFVGAATLSIGAIGAGIAIPILASEGYIG